MLHQPSVAGELRGCTAGPRRREEASGAGGAGHIDNRPPKCQVDVPQVMKVLAGSKHLEGAM